MKKILTVAVFALVGLFIWAGSVSAAEPSFVLTPTVSKTEVADGQEVKITFSIGNFQNIPSGQKNGINAFSAILEYDTNVFYTITGNVVDEEVKDLIETGEVINQTNNNQSVFQAETNWGGVTYNYDTKKFVVERSGSSFSNDGEKVISIIFKVKGGTPKGDYKIKLKEAQGSNSTQDINAVGPNGSSDIEINIPVISGGGDDVYEDPDGNLFVRSLPDKKVQDFKAKVVTTLKNKFNYSTVTFKSVKTEKGTDLKDTDFITNGATIEIEQSDKKINVVVVGDLDSNGRCTVNDLSKLKLYETNQNITLTTNEQRAVDVKYDQKNTVADRSFIKWLITGAKDFNPDEWYGDANTTPECKPVLGLYDPNNPYNPANR